MSYEDRQARRASRDADRQARRDARGERWASFGYSHARASLVTPLILIVIGALFLANNVWPSFSVLDAIARYWPWALILWGSIRLLEILLWASGGKALPARGIGGFEWFLVILLTCIGASASTTRHFGWSNGRFMRGVEVFGESFDYPLEASKASGPAPRVIIENLRGNTRIVGADANVVKVTGRKTVKAFQQSDADDSNRKSPLELTVEGDQVVIRTNQERVTGDRRVTADLEITVPKGASIEARGRNGDFEVSDLQGGVDISSDNAGIRLQTLGGPVRVDTRRSDIIRAVGMKGPVELKGRGQDIELENIDGPVTINGTYSGEVQFRNLAKPLRFENGPTQLRVERIPGQIRMALGSFSGSNVIGPIQLTAKKRDVELIDFTQAVEISLEGGDVQLRPTRVPLSKLDVHSRSGNIEFSVPAGAKFDLKATSNRGDVNNVYGAPFKTDSYGKNGGTMTGSLGPGPLVTLTTERGTVTVQKAGAPETPEAAPSAPRAPPEPPAPLKVEDQ